MVPHCGNQHPESHQRPNDRGYHLCIAGHLDSLGRVTIVGFSTGAYAGSVVALSGDDHSLETCRSSGPAATADAFVGYEGPYDWATSSAYANNVPPLEQTDPESWSALNPYFHIDRNPDLAVRLVQGVDNDTAGNDTRPEVAEQFEQALADAEHDVQLILIDGAPPRERPKSSTR